MSADADTRPALTAYLEDRDFTLYNGDALDVLLQLPDESVDCVVTSPPYWGIRDYGTAAWDGGDADCDHIQRIDGKQGAVGNTLGHDATHPNRRSLPPTKHSQIVTQYSSVCGKCGARRIDQQLGLEPTPDIFVSNMVALFHEVKRVLRKDGTCWVNFGDGYNANTGRGFDTNKDGDKNSKKSDDKNSKKSDAAMAKRIRWGRPKDLIGIPWRFALALQADGWYLRSDIIWSKPNPMPESAKDRPTRAHEYVFLLTRSPSYFYDADAISENVTGNAHPRGNGVNPKARQNEDARAGIRQNASFSGAINALVETRNARSVWEIATQPYPEAHFATFPEELPRRCIAAGSPADGVILDPFMGSGTVALVARKLGRRSIGIELSTEYCEQIARRLGQQSLLAEVL